MKKLKISTSYEDNLEQATLQCDVVLERLKSINGHASQNVLKRWQSLIDRTPITQSSSPSPSDSPPPKESTTPFIGDSSSNPMASQYSSTSNVCDAFLLRKMDINRENFKKN